MTEYQTKRKVVLEQRDGKEPFPELPYAIHYHGDGHPISELFETRAKAEARIGELSTELAAEIHVIDNTGE